MGTAGEWLLGEEGGRPRPGVAPGDAEAAERS